MVEPCEFTRVANITLVSVCFLFSQNVTNFDFLRTNSPKKFVGSHFRCAPLLLVEFTWFAIQLNYYPRKSIPFGWLICASECVYNRINSRFKWNLFNALTLIRWNVWNIVTLDKKVVTLLNNHRINRQLTSDGQVNPNRCDFPNDYIWNENKWKHTKIEWQQQQRKPSNTFYIELMNRLLFDSVYVNKKNSIFLCHSHCLVVFLSPLVNTNNSMCILLALWLTTVMYACSELSNQRRRKKTIQQKYEGMERESEWALSCRSDFSLSTWIMSHMTHIIQYKRAWLLTRNITSIMLRMFNLTDYLTAIQTIAEDFR